ncbi:NAD(P)-binding protein [Hypoxylon sp. EC38]|nr:NAD(P)-binding protein [Hypoxylon sp. EC38]
MTATVFITGGTGPVGFRILLEALAAGHNVRYAAPSEKIAQIVSGNPKIQARKLGDRLSPFIIPDFTAKGAFDIALKGVTHIIDVRPLVPHPDTHIVFQTIVKTLEEILSSALKTPSIQRIVFTSSIMANAGYTPSCASTRLPLSTVTSFKHPGEAFVAAMMVALKRADEFVETHKPHFTVSHVLVGQVVGHNELALDAEMAAKGSNNFLLMMILGMEAPGPIPGNYAHIDDVAEVHLRVAFLDPKEGEPKDFGVATKADYSEIFDIIERAIPKQAADGLFKKSKVPTVSVEYDTSETEKLLGRKFKSFESAVVDMARGYIELVERSKAAPKPPVTSV